MTGLLEYTLALNDKMSATLRTITGTSEGVINKLKGLQDQSKRVSESLNATGNSVGSLREKLNLLRNEKELIPQKNIQAIRNYNTEIRRLEGQISRLDNIGTSGFRSKLQDAVSATPIAGLITNPLAQASVAMFAATQASLSFEEGMAKINTTAQLSSSKLTSLRDKLMDMGRNTGTDLKLVPDAFEKINSQINDVEKSTSILEASLNGAKAGFTDVNIVAGALAQSMSAIGDNNTKAQDVLDTLFAAKRVGAGEFQDFATYVPQLIASGRNIGVGFKDAAGLFAYMTGKGNKAAESAMLLQNAFTALSKTDITSKLNMQGVATHDSAGKMLGLDVFFGNLSKRMAGMSDKMRAQFLESVDLKDAQAKQAFSVLISDQTKLQEALGATRKAAGETSNALAFSNNPMQRLHALWSSMQEILINVGAILSDVLIPALEVVGSVVKTVYDGVNWWVNAFKEGNIVIRLTTLVLGTLAVAFTATKLTLMAHTAVVGLYNLATTGAIFQTGMWTGAAKVLSFTMWTIPIFPIILGIVALIAVIAYVVKYTYGWGEAWKHTITGSKMLFWGFVEKSKSLFTTMVEAFMIGINKLKASWYEFKELIGLGNTSENQMALAKINADTQSRMKAIIDGQNKAKTFDIAADSEFKKAANSIHTDKMKSFSDISTDVKRKLGIQDPTTAGTNKNVGLLGGDGTGKKGGKNAAQKTNEAIATGGSKHNYVTINLKDLIGVLTINTNSTKEGIGRMQEDATDSLLRVLAMATTTAG